MPPAPTAPLTPSHEFRPPLGPDRIEAVRRATELWKTQLIDTGGRNRLLFYRDFTASTLDLSPSRPEIDGEVVDQLLAGRSVEVARLAPDPDHQEDLTKRVRNMYRKARENLEERGIATLYLGIGIATWDRDGPTPASPLVLLPLELTPIGGSYRRFRAAVSEDAEINPVLVHHLASEHGLDLRVDEYRDRLSGTLSHGVLAAVCRDLHTRCGSLPGFSVEAGRIVLANLSYATMPMVTDLEGAVAELAESELVAALAGVEGAFVDSTVEPAKSLPNEIPPADEFLVLDADASQNWAINAVLAGKSIVIEGPPGTGKSQTIANLIGSLIARRKRVLFVAEKRAAIDAVVKRLTAVGLGDLLLDLHGGIRSKRELASQLGRSLVSAGEIAEKDHSEPQAALTARRRTLNEHSTTMHAERSPSGYTAYELQGLIMSAPPGAKVSTRLSSQVLANLATDERRKVKEDLVEWAQLGGPQLTSDRTLWAKSTVRTPDEAQDAFRVAAALASVALPNATATLNRVLTDTQLASPESLTEWRDRISLLTQIEVVLDHFQQGIYGEGLTGWNTALQPARRNIFRRIWSQLSDRAYRDAKAEVRERLLPRKRLNTKRLCAMVESALDQDEQWRELSQEKNHPHVPPSLAQAKDGLASIEGALRELEDHVTIAHVEELVLTDLQKAADRLVEEQPLLYRLPKLRELEGSLQRKGLGDLVSSITLRSVDPDLVGVTFDYIVASSIYDRLSAPKMVNNPTTSSTTYTTPVSGANRSRRESAISTSFRAGSVLVAS